MVIYVQQILIQTLTGTDKVFQNEQGNRKSILKENSKISNCLGYQEVILRDMSVNTLLLRAIKAIGQIEM